LRQGILERCGSIGAAPYRIDVVSLLLETPYGLWAAPPIIKAEGMSKKKRKIGKAVFQWLDEAKGRFADLLPKKAGGTLH
jgi:hypothetical protein